MINKKLILAALVLIIGIPVKAEPVGNPAQDPKVPAPAVQDISHAGKRKLVNKENKKVEKTAKATGSTKTSEPKAGEAIPSTDSNKKTN